MKFNEDFLKALSFSVEDPFAIEVPKYSKSLNESLNEDKTLNEDANNQIYFRAYVANLGKYNEGELVGTWVDFPIDEDDFDEVLRRIGINNEYEEWFVADYECSLDAFDWEQFGEYPSYESLQDFALELEDIDDVTAVDNAYELTGDLEEAIEGLNNGNIIFLSGIDTLNELGYYVIDEMYGGIENLDSSTISSYIDYDALGRDLSMEFDEDSMGETIGEYYCGNEDASYTEIGEEYFEAVGVDISNPQAYFDYEAFGRDYDLTVNGMFTKNGYVEEI